MRMLRPENQSGPQQHFLLTLQQHISFHLLLPEIIFPPLRAKCENASLWHPLFLPRTHRHTPYTIHTIHTHTHRHTEASHKPHTQTQTLPHSGTSPQTPSLSGVGEGVAKTALITVAADVLNRTSKTHQNLISLQYQFFLSKI